MSKFDEEQISELKDYFGKQLEIVLGAVNKIEKNTENIESEFSSYQRDNEKILIVLNNIEGQNKSIIEMFGRLTEKTVDGITKATTKVIEPAVKELTDKMDVIGDTKMGKPTEETRKKWLDMKKVWNKISFWNRTPIFRR